MIGAIYMTIDPKFEDVKITYAKLSDVAPKFFAVLEFLLFNRED